MWGSQPKGQKVKPEKGKPLEKGKDKPLKKGEKEKGKPLGKRRLWEKARRSGGRKGSGCGSPS